MHYDSTHITLLDVEGQPGLLLWSRPKDTSAPKRLQSSFSRGRWRSSVRLLTPKKRGRALMERKVEGWWLNASEAAVALAELPLGQLREYSNSVAVWTLASKWVIEAVTRQQLVPSLTAAAGEGEPWQARWRVAPVRPVDRSRISGLAASMPGVARACPTDDDQVRTPSAAVATYLDAAADGLMRARTGATAPRPGQGPAWARRLAESLAGPDASFVPTGLGERNLPAALQGWTASATSLGSGNRPIIGFRLEEPNGNGAWRVTYHLHAPGGEGRLAVESLAAGDPDARQLADSMTRPEESLLEALARASRNYPWIEQSLNEKLPVGVDVDASGAWQFLSQASTALEAAGYYVEVPSALSKVGKRYVRAQIRIGVGRGKADEVQSTGLLGAVVRYRWEASLGDDTLSRREFLALAKAKAPLVLHRGKWVAVDPDEVERIGKLIEDGGGRLTAAEALRMALAGEVQVPEAQGVQAHVVTDGDVSEALEALIEGVDAQQEDREVPAGLVGVLRPYQKRGFAWMHSVTDTGFGACLADDMGLGKTIQLLTLAQSLAEEHEEPVHVLVVAPTSVIGNWRRETNRFTPEMGVVIHHGPSRAQTYEGFERRLDSHATDRGVIVITSYALVRGDRDFITTYPFDIVALDEAQNIKNPESAQSRAVRQLLADRRVALSGTPVENRLTELWSIMDFLNPGLLGSRESFKKTFAIPVERYGDKDAADRLRRVTAPFVLRRMKTDPKIAPELPDKIEVVRYCPLTREQAALYKATIDACMDEIADLGPGIQRRGLVLGMLTKLKQICNHPAHRLKDERTMPRRSGKFVRFMELVEEMDDSGGRALVFTQYREMGTILQTELSKHLGESIPFLHGGLSRMARERMVADYQLERGPTVMVISLKAGGTGLNLTRANHVFHYDRWWNPAVEDQATDRAFRIGQTKDVTVHLMVTQGTLEEQIHALLEEKRNLADRVVGTGETWLSELDDETLAELVSLGQDAVLEDP